MKTMRRRRNRVSEKQKRAFDRRPKADAKCAANGDVANAARLASEPPGVRAAWHAKLAPEPLGVRDLRPTLAPGFRLVYSSVMDSVLNSATWEECAAMLRWQVEMGVDLAIDDAPHDRFAESLAIAEREAAAMAHEPRGAVLPRFEEAPAPPIAPPPPSSEPAVASAAAARATSLDALKRELEAFEDCGLKRSATQLVFSDGTPNARLMLIGEAPGADEDRIGRPFVGRAGKLLDLMLAAIELDRNSVYIANVVPWRPPGNRTPTPLETALCKPFALRQIALVNPQIIVCLGNSSAQTLLGFKEGVTRTRGRWAEFVDPASGAPPIRAMATLHPAYLLRRPGDKRLVWRDFRQIRRALDNFGERD